METLWHGAEVGGLEPADLRQKVSEKHQKAVARHHLSPQ